MRDLSKYGPWCVITGASSGIGREFALELAGRGLNVALVARRADRLEQVAEECRALGREALVCPVDLTKPEAVPQLLELLGDREVGLLVNNAGIVAHGKFHEIARERQHSLMYLNLVAPMMLAHALLPGMLERNRGGVIFVASTSAHYFHPQMATYAVSKQAGRSLGSYLGWELRGTNVDCLVLTPGSTDTELFEAGDMVVTNDTLPPGYSLQSPKRVVRTALRWIGYRREVIVTSLMERFTILLAKIIPPFIMRPIIALAAKNVQAKK